MYLALIIGCIVNSALTAPTDVTSALPANQINYANETSSCQVGTEKYNNGNKIPREDPFELCMCLDGEVFCWWQNHMKTEKPCRESQLCNNHSKNGTEEEQQPDDAMSTMRSEKSTNTESISSVGATQSTVPAATLCLVMGKEYKIGQVLPQDTGTCLECVCDKNADISCSPKGCSHPDESVYRRQYEGSMDIFDVDSF